MKNYFTLLTLGCVILAAVASGGPSSASCLQPPPYYYYPTCSHSDVTLLYYYDIEQNECLSYVGCPLDELEYETENVFNTSADCELECYRPIVTCPLQSPQDHSSSMMMCTGDQTPDCRIYYFCEKGYRNVFGIFETVCLPNGTWSAEPPLCGRLVILHGEEEINENVEMKDGDSNIQLRCTMEPTFPPTAPVTWYPHGNTSWSVDHSAYVLTIEQLNFRDAGDYICSLSYTEFESYSLERKIKIIVVPNTDDVVGIKQYPPLWLFNLLYRIARMTCIFEGLPKPTISWYYRDRLANGTYNDHQLDLSQGKFIVTDHSQNSIRFAVSSLIFQNPTANDQGEYVCVASNAYESVASAVNLTASSTGLKRSAVIPSSFDKAVVFIGKRVGRKLSDGRYRVSVSEQLTLSPTLAKEIIVKGVTNDIKMRQLPTVFFVQLIGDDDEYTFVSSNPLKNSTASI